LDLISIGIYSLSFTRTHTHTHIHTHLFFTRLHGHSYSQELEGHGCHTAWLHKGTTDTSSAAVAAATAAALQQASLPLPLEDTSALDKHLPVSNLNNGHGDGDGDGDDSGGGGGGFLKGPRSLSRAPSKRRLISSATGQQVGQVIIQVEHWKWSLSEASDHSGGVSDNSGGANGHF